MSGLLDRYAFGWIEGPWTCRTPEIEIFPTDDFTLAVSEITSSGIASRDWIYPPIVQRADRHIAGPSIRFLLRSTHYLKIDPTLDRPELSDFLIMVLGFFLGLKLNPAGLGHLHRTPRRKGFLVNFVDTGHDLERAVRRTIEFFHAHEANSEVLSLTNAAFHWYLTSQSYHHAFEVFTFQYSVLDNMHKLTELLSPMYRAMLQKDPQKTGGHTKRPVNLSTHYDIPLPPEFQDASSQQPNAKRLAQARNTLIHEARWLGYPLGYAADSESWDLLKNLEHFNSHLLLGVLGIQCKFRSVLYDRNTHALEVTNN